MTDTPPGSADFGPPGYGYGSPNWAPPGADAGTASAGTTSAGTASAGPGGVPLRPLAVGDILSGTFALIRQNPAATIGLVFIGTVAGVILAVVLGVLADHSSFAPLAETPAFLLDAAVGGGALAALGQAFLGRKIGIGEALRRSRLGWVLLTSSCYWFVIALVWIAPLVLLHGYGVLVAFPLGAWLGVMLCLMFPVVVLERRNSAAAIGRSWQLVRGSFWRVFGIFTLLVIVMIAVLFAIGTVLTIAGGLSFSLVHDHGAIAGGAAVGAAIASALLYFAISCVVTTLWTAVIVLLYADARMRKEGMDLVLAQAIARAPLTGDEFASNIPRRPATGPTSAWPASPPA